MAAAESTLLHGIGDTGGGDGELSIGSGRVGELLRGGCGKRKEKIREMIKGKMIFGGWNSRLYSAKDIHTAIRNKEERKERW